MVKFFQISENKMFELQLEWFETSWSYFNFSVECTRKMDHAGFRFNFEIMSLYFHIWICDNRHWNYKKECWFTSEEFGEIIKKQRENI